MARRNDSNPGSGPQRLVLYVAGAAAALFVLLWAASGLIVDWLWFRSEGYASVFWRQAWLKWAGGAGLGAIPALGLLINGLVALRGPRGRGELEGLVLNLGLGPARRVSFRVLLGAAAALLFILYTLGATAVWADLALWRGAHEFAGADPIFRRNPAFYVFALPALQRLLSAAWLGLVAGTAATASIYMARGWAEVIPLQGDSRARPRVRLAPGARIHMAALAAIAMLFVAASIQLRRHGMMFEQRAGGAGPTYVQASAVMPLLLAQSLAAVIGAGLVFAGIARGRMRPIVSAFLMLAIGAVALGVYPSFLQKFKVEANELKVERPYLAHLIEGTRRAFKLDNVEERVVSGAGDLTAADIEANRPTIDNIRLWDDGPLLETYSQIQEIWTSYDFASVGADRYRIDGRLRQTTISARELEPKSLVNPTWVNLNMTYTHGYGAVMGPINEVTEAGLPELWVKDMPATVAKPELRVDRPQIYFGQLADNPVYVNTRHAEFDYPAGAQNVFHTYEGKGGIPVGGFLRRLLFAFDFNDMKVLLTGDFAPESRALIHREVRGRLQRVAPFITWDPNIYLVVHEGRLVWMADGYTASDRYPYAAAPARGLNYVRNSVKATVDAYTGRMDFYLADPDDPIIATWADLFPGLFKPISAMPEGLRAHVRVPLWFFNVQAAVYATYHMSEPQAFYNQEDKWEIPTLKEGGKDVPLEPYYLVTRLPEESAEEFILMLPFAPISKSNLAAWLAARNDGPNYGKLVVYRFPRERLVYGPGQVRARIEQDEHISPQLTLWGQQGSNVLRGTPLAIPIDHSILYAQPIYIRAENGRIPEFKRVVLAYENRLSMEPTLEAALRRVIEAEAAGAAQPGPAASGTAAGTGAAGGSAAAGAGALGGPKTPGAANGPGGANGPSGAAQPTEPTGPAGTDRDELIRQAKGNYDRAIQAQRQGDWAAYGREIDGLGRALERLGAISATPRPEQNPAGPAITPAPTP